MEQKPSGWHSGGKEDEKEDVVKMRFKMGKISEGNEGADLEEQNDEA